MIGTIAASPSSGSKPSSRSRARKCAVSRAASLDELRLAAQDAHRLERAAGDRRRQRVREQLRPRALGEDVADLLARRDEAAGRAAERLAERGRDHVDLAEQRRSARRRRGRSRPSRRCRASRRRRRRASCSRASSTMSGSLARSPSIEKTPSVITSSRCPGSQRLELRAQVVHVGVLVDRLPRRLREPDRVDDRRVVELVGEDHRRSRRSGSGSPPRSRSSTRRR